MAHIIEAAKSGRATCRACKEKIEKGALRFGEEVPNQFGDEPSYQWHHLPCAAKKKPVQLQQALAAFDGDVPDREELERAIEANKGKAKATTLPYAEKAPTGRSKCMACDEPIAKGTLRIAVEREVDTGSFVTRGAGYLHPACAAGSEHAEEPEFAARVRQNSVSLSAAELDEVEAALGRA